MPSYNFSSDTFQGFCKDNSLSVDEAIKIVFNRITELNKLAELKSLKTQETSRNGERTFTAISR